MAVRGIRRPVALRGKHLGHQQTAGHIPALHGDVIDISGVGPLAALHAFDALRPKPRNRIIANVGRCTDRMNAVGGGLRRPVGAARHIKRMGRGFFKHRQARAHFAKALPACGDLGLAFHQHQNDFGLCGMLGHLIAGFQTVKTKAHVGPPGRGRRDIIKLAIISLWGEMKIAHTAGSVLIHCLSADEVCIASTRL